MNIKDVLRDHARWLDGNRGERADLRDADLENAKLQGAKLQGANLRFAKLRFADLRFADLPHYSEILKAQWLDDMSHIEDDEQRAQALLERYCRV